MTKVQMAELIEQLRTAIQAAAEELEGEGGLDYSARCDRALDVLHDALRIEDEATRGGKLLTTH